VIEYRGHKVLASTIHEVLPLSVRQTLHIHHHWRCFISLWAGVNVGGKQIVVTASAKPFSWL